MRVAALYDIHGNLPALEAVLAEVRQAGVDEIVVGGDVHPGPMPRATMDCLLGLELPVRFIHGNGDREVLSRLRGTETDTVPEQFRQPLWWTAQQLGAGDEAILASWPPTLRVAIDDVGDVLFCHATPRNDTEIFTVRTPEARLLPAFAGVDAALVVCGHTHMPFDRMVGRTRVVNAGSVGMPFCAPGAYWLLLGPDVELRRTSYDLASAATRIRGTTYPGAAEFADRYVLQPPTEEETLRLYSRYELT